MRVLLKVQMPHEPFNTLAREGLVQQKLTEIIDEIEPEAAYFTEYEGKRGAFIVVDLDQPSGVPALAEPFFLTFNADVHFQICMTVEDLGSAGLERLGERWR